MNIEALTGPSLGPANRQAPTAAVVLLHGYGASGDDLIGLAPYFAQALPQTVFYAPNAPHPWEGGGFGGRQWFGLPGYDPVTMQRDPQRHVQTFRALVTGTAAAAGVLDTFLDQVLARHNLKPERLALLGFSQGTMMALHVGLRRPEPIAAILGYSGALTGADRLAREIRSKPPVAVIHGSEDPVIPVKAITDIVETLTDLGVPVESHVVPGLQHGIDNTGAELGAAFLKKHLV